MRPPAVIQLSCFFILERMAEVLAARFRQQYFKAMLRQDQEWCGLQLISLPGGGPPSLTGFAGGTTF